MVTLLSICKTHACMQKKKKREESKNTNRDKGIMKALCLKSWNYIVFNIYETN